MRNTLLPFAVLSAMALAACQPDTAPPPPAEPPAPAVAKVVPASTAETPAPADAAADPRREGAVRLVRGTID